MKATIHNGLLVLGAVGLVSMAAVSDVSARGISGGAGRAVNAGDQSCFSLFANGVRNNCTTARAFEVPLSVDTHGVKNMTFTGNSVTCQARASDQFLGELFGTQGTIASALNSSSVSVTMPAAGRLWLACTVQPQGRLINVNYLQ